MKFKQQEEETPKNNPFLDSIGDLIQLCIEFEYAIKSRMDFMKEKCEVLSYYNALNNNLQSLVKLFISLNPEHKRPTFSPELTPADSTKDLMKFEEKYYNMLKAIGDNAMEANNIEVVSYLSNIIINFKHYFCTLDEDNDSGETSS
jgi:hypothetical protein